MKLRNNALSVLLSLQAFRCFAEDAEAADAVTEAPEPAVETTTSEEDRWNKHRKTVEEMTLYIDGKRGYNYHASTVVAPKYYDYFSVKSTMYLGDNKANVSFLPGDVEFYRAEFNLFDQDNNGVLSQAEVTARQTTLDGLINPQLGYSADHELFVNTLEKASRFFEDVKEGDALPDLSYDAYTQSRAVTDLLDGYALYKMHDNYARRHGRAPENKYICIAEYGWMMRMWVSLLDQYAGPYEGQVRKTDFRKKYSATNDGKYMILELAAWKTRIFNSILFGEQLYGESDY